MKDKTAILLPEATYHIFNRANGSEKLFLSDENYNYFLKKYKEAISPIVETFAYCLMPNHFHFLIRCKDEISLFKHFSECKPATLTEFKTLSALREQQIYSKLMSLKFSHFFNGYTQAINKERGRKGTLFMRPYKRIAVKDNAYQRKLVHYIHFNPVEAGCCKKPENWAYSSYPIFLNEDSRFVEVNEVITWFNDKKNFFQAHSSSILNS